MCHNQSQDLLIRVHQLPGLAKDFPLFFLWAHPQFLTSSGLFLPSLLHLPSLTICSILQSSMHISLNIFRHSSPWWFLLDSKPYHWYPYMPALPLWRSFHFLIYFSSSFPHLHQHVLLFCFWIVFWTVVAVQRPSQRVFFSMLLSTFFSLNSNIYSHASSWVTPKHSLMSSSTLSDKISNCLLHSSTQWTNHHSTSKTLPGLASTSASEPNRKKYSLLRDKYFREDSRIRYLRWKSLNTRSEWENIK